jgi:NADPH:quinone reductase-like Zn-dependent oxidoreductase
MKGIVFDRFGEPVKVLGIKELPVPKLGRGELRVRMLASPINPSDLLVVRGEYGRLPQLPAIPGFEGVGMIEEVGPGLISRMRGLRVGRRVAVPNSQGGNWQEQVVASARQVILVPASVPDDQAAGFFVNPASALALTQYVLQVPRGAWLLQTAAAGSLGRMIIRLGKHFGFRTINLVRRREQAEELLALGADAAINTASDSVEECVKSLTNGQGVPYALDAVGGSVAGSVVGLLAPHGRLVLYGTLSGQPVSIDPRAMMIKELRVEGFWLSHWVRQQNPLTMLGLFRRIGRLFESGVLVTPIAASFALSDFAKAVQLAQDPSRNGKVLFRMV